MVFVDKIYKNSVKNMNLSLEAKNYKIAVKTKNS